METKNNNLNKKKILIVEDRALDLAKGIWIAEKRGYSPIWACDLEQALEKIKINNISGIITDMNFPEEGASYSKNFYGEILCDRRIELINGRRINTPGIPSETLDVKNFWQEYFIYAKKEIAARRLSKERTEILRKLALDNSDLVRKSYRWVQGNEGHYEGFPLNLEKISECSGYFVLDKAKELDIPIVPITSLGHDTFTLVPLLKKGFVTLEELSNESDNCSIRYVSSQRRSTERKISKETIERSGFSIDELAQIDKNELDFSSRIVLGEIPFCLPKAILPLRKSVLAYSLAIDILEGKIDQTRPYDYISFGGKNDN